jgi:hypothetical protein
MNTVFSQEFDRAVFTVSIDFELMWGTADRPYAHAFRGLCETERKEVVDRLLELLTRYQIPATWGIVGHLFLDEAERNVARMKASDPGRLYHAADLVRRIQTCPVEQDIGSHTFCHIEMDDWACSKTKAELEVQECVHQARKWGIEMKSFIFPRNRVGHLDVLKRHGFSCYRGPEPQWYANRRRVVRRLGHLLDIARMATPPSVMPVEQQRGLWNIPGSMLYTPSFGARQVVPVWMRVRRAKAGLDRAVKRNQVFHLWFHPTDLACRKDAMLKGLERIFAYAAKLRSADRLRVKTMRDLAPPAGAAGQLADREEHFVA